jgi:hypothetical protein
MIKIYCKNKIYPQINSIIHKYYPNIKTKQMGYSKKFKKCGAIAYSKIKDKEIYYYGEIDEYVILHELNHIFVNECQKIKTISDDKFDKIITKIKAKFEKSEIPRALYPLNIHEEYLVDKEVFKNSPSLIKTTLHSYINQSKRSKGLDLYCDFLTLSYLYKIYKSAKCKISMERIKSKLPNNLIKISNNFIEGIDIYKNYVELLKIVDDVKIVRL